VSVIADTDRDWMNSHIVKFITVLCGNVRVLTMKIEIRVSSSQFRRRLEVVQDQTRDLPMRRPNSKRRIIRLAFGEKLGY
jgi:hypothetical protein